MTDKKQKTPPASMEKINLPPHLQALAEADSQGSGDGRTASPHRRGPRHGGFRGGGGGGGRWRRPLEIAGNPWGTFCRLLRLLRRHLSWFLVMFILAGAGSGLGLWSPILLGRAVDSLNVSKNGLAVDFDRLYLCLAGMAIMHVGNALISFLQGWISAKISQGIMQRWRQDIFTHLQTLPLTYFDGRTHGEVLSRVTNDVSLVSRVMANGVVDFFASLIMLVGALLAMLFLSGWLTLTSLVTLPLSFLVTKILSRKIRACFLAQQTVLGLLNGHVEEMISAQRTVKAFNHERQAITDFEVLNQELRRLGLRARLLSGIMWPSMSWIGNLSYALLAGFGGWLASQGSITIGVIAAFIQYARQFSRPVNEIAHQYHDIQSALAGAERVFSLLDEKPEPNPENNTQEDNYAKVQGELVFEQVGFAYKKGEPVLKDFSLQIKPGQKIALVGSTGAGKTTVASLLLRFYNPQFGEIRLDDQPLPTWPLSRLRRSFAMVLQDTWLFGGTVRDNIRYGRLESSDAEVEWAAQQVGADIFIQRLPDGYDTVLSENGGNLSQGQRQLLAIARAVLADPPILILDEATSSVDTRTELIVQRAMIHLMRGRTCLIIAHRLSTIRDADAILVLEQGKIIEQGNRKQLLERKGAYWRLEQNQFGQYAQ
jgi:ATP-binding cassette subfamily B multidrug efflux pump